MRASAGHHLGSPAMLVAGFLGHGEQGVHGQHEYAWPPRAQRPARRPAQAVRGPI